MTSLKALAGQRFGKLVVLERDLDAYKSGGFAKWVCQCDCGNKVSVISANLTRGNTRSCGCLRTKNTHVGTKLYSAWRQMRQRCENPADAAFGNYGGRGIKVCDRWAIFENFFKDMGHPPHGATLDRKDNDGPYSPENCRWATWKQQHNNKRTNRLITAFGKTQTLQQWADEYQMPLTTLRNRLDRAGLAPEQALTTPVRRSIKL